VGPARLHFLDDHGLSDAPLPMLRDPARQHSGKNQLKTAAFRRWRQRFPEVHRSWFYQDQAIEALEEARRCVRRAAAELRRTAAGRSKRRQRGA
jgi:hypothetical protein